MILIFTLSFGNVLTADGGTSIDNNLNTISNGIGSNPVFTPQITTDPPIIINGNPDFIGQASTNGWDGDGSSSTPYLLNNLSLVVGGASDGISISNTDVHFILSNSLITDVTGWSAVNMNNVSNAVITRNEVAFSGRGITINGGSNVAITDNDVHDNTVRGINLQNIQGITVSGNSVSFTGAEAVVAESGARNNIIRNNHIFNNSQGIVIWAGASGNQLLSNRIEHSSNDGIFVQDSSSVVIESNTLYFNLRLGVNLATGSTLARLRWNTFEWNNGGTEQFTDDGIDNWIELNHFNEFTGPDVDNNKIYDSPYLTISGQDNSPLVLPYRSSTPSFTNLNNSVQHRPLQLSWLNPTNTYNHSSSSSLYYSTNFGLSWTSVAFDITGQTYLWDPVDVPSGTSVQLRLDSQTSENLISSVRSNSFVLNDPTLPSDPKDVIVTVFTDVIDLSWSAPNTFGTHNFTSYSVFRGSSVGALNFHASTINLWYNDSEVVPGLTYFYAISASSTAGEGNLSIPYTITILDNQPPTFTIEGLNEGINSLTGQRLISINPSDNGIIDRVEVELIINGLNTSLITLTTSPYEFVFDSTTIDDGTYSITVSVFDKSGNSISVTYAVTIKNNTIISSSSSTTTTSETSTSDNVSSSSTSVDGANLPLPFDIISSVIGLISLVSLIFVRRKFR
ncbi:MAG: right-handed parallel beta-helix repeat-containing protein [Candidatus Heimdallarchaeota archaeon]|nr:right-handed parallel beta-helix repeat-containing protein [Candidatus Heimdallarchaeota archaeon]